MFGSLGFLGNFGDADSTGARFVLLNFTFSFNPNTWSENNYINDYKQQIYQAFVDAGFGTTLDNITLSQQVDDYGNTTANAGMVAGFAVTNNYTAEQQRQNAVAVLGAIKTGWLSPAPLFTNITAQITSDQLINNGQIISNRNIPSTVNANPNTVNIINKTLADTATDIAKKGALGTGLSGLSTLLFGAGNENLSIFGTSVNKVALIGGLAGALLLADTLSKRK